MESLGEYREFELLVSKVKGTFAGDEAGEVPSHEALGMRTCDKEPNLTLHLKKSQGRVRVGEKESLGPESHFF